MSGGKSSKDDIFPNSYILFLHAVIVFNILTSQAEIDGEKLMFFHRFPTYPKSKIFARIGAVASRINVNSNFEAAAQNDLILQWTTILLDIRLALIFSYLLLLLRNDDTSRHLLSQTSLLFKIILTAFDPPFFRFSRLIFSSHNGVRTSEIPPSDVQPASQPAYQSACPPTSSRQTIINRRI